MRDVVDRCPYHRRVLFGEHTRNRDRWGDLSRQTLHENCPDRHRLNAIGEAVDCFGFQTSSTAQRSGQWFDRLATVYPSAQRAPHAVE
jgi:hypothetical protein